MPIQAQPLTRAPRDLAAWVALFELATLPVLAETVESLRELAPAEDAVDARMLADAVVDDPLMTIRVLGHVAHLRRGREGSETETVTESLVMLGVPPFFRAFSSLADAESLLASTPGALEGFRRVLRRSRRAARFAMAFAVHRMDTDAAVIHEAALLHDFAELLVWLRAPALMLEIQARQRADATLRSLAVQKELLNVSLRDLEHALMLKWRLPSLLVKITDEATAQPTAQMRNVQLAIRVARHSETGWDNAALPDDVQDLAQLLNLSREASLGLLHDVEAEDGDAAA